MRVAFIQKDPLPDPYTALVAAQVVYRGHQARVFLPAAEHDLEGSLRRFAPGALVFHVAGGFDEWAVRVGQRLKRALGRPPVCTIGRFGSDHPELALRDGIDFVLTGDPDETLAELLWRITMEKTLPGTMGTVCQGPDGELLYGPPRAEIQDLDETPAADLEIYQRYGFVAGQRTGPMCVGRGTVENLHAGFRIGLAEVAQRFRPARRLSVEQAIARIHRMRNRRRYRRFGFRDDSLTLDPDWLALFLDQYRHGVGMPFGIMARPDQLAPKLIDGLADAGCDCVRLGIESGDEALRRQAAGTALPDALIEDVVARLRSKGIRVHTVSWLGLPGETRETALRTVELVARLRPDHAFCFTVHDDPEASTTPALQRLAWLVPYVSQAPRLAPLVTRAMDQPGDALYQRLFLLQHDLGFIRSGELPAFDIARIAARMSRKRAG